MKREGSPSPRGPGHPTDILKSRPHDSMVTTVKEGGRSIHLIPPEGVVIGKPKEGSITQVTGFDSCFLTWYGRIHLANKFKYSKILEVVHFSYIVYFIFRVKKKFCLKLLKINKIMSTRVLFCTSTILTIKVPGKTKNSSHRF